MLVKWVITLVMIISFSEANAQNSGQDSDDDGQGSPTSSTPILIVQPGVGLRLQVNSAIKLYQDFRSYHNSDGSLNFGELSFGVRHNLGDLKKVKIDVTGGILVSLDSSLKIKEYRPKFYLNAKWKLKRFRGEFRNRFEYRIKVGDNSGTSLRYRPRIKLGLNRKYTGFHLTPYVYSEFFIGENGFSQTRIKLALSGKVGGYAITLGNLFKIKNGNGFTEDRISLDVSYTFKDRN